MLDILVLRFEVFCISSITDFDILLLKMSQEMNILCCYSCTMYQVHIVKKARKWQCKICNAKQSVQQVYFQGSGKDCRLRVQQLNYSKPNEMSFSAIASGQNDNSIFNTSANISHSDNDQVVESRWAKYLDSPKKKDLSDTRDISIREIKDTMSSGRSSYNDMNNDLYDFENMEDFEFVAEDTHGTRELSPVNCSQNTNMDNKCSQSNKNTVT